MRERWRALGKFFNSLKGWVWVVTVALPPVATWLAGYFEGQPWTYVVPAVTVALAAGVLIANQGLALAKRILGYRTSRQDQRRIAKDLKDLSSSRT